MIDIFPKCAARRHLFCLPVLVLACQGLVFAQQYTISTVAGGGPVRTPALSNQVSIGPPQSVATDSAGNLYFASLNSVYQVNAQTSFLTLVAGNSRAGYSGDGGPAISAQLSSPVGLAIDASGNVYIADSGNNRVRKVLTNGIIVTVAGTGVSGYSGDNGPAVNAQLAGAQGVVLDSSGNLFVADSGNNRVRKVTPTGIISTVAGNGSAVFAGDGGQAVAGQLSASSIAIDALGNLFVGDPVNYRVREISAGGVITTIAGSGSAGYNGDGGAGQGAQISAVHGVAVDQEGNVYIADSGNSCIREISSGAGIISTVAGIGKNQFFGDNGTATSAALAFPLAVVLDSSNNIFIADTGNNRVRAVIASSGNIQTVAGNGVLSYSGDGGPAVSAQLSSPFGVALDTSGNLYIADTSSNVIRKVTANGTINTVAGNGTAGYTGDNGPVSGAEMSHPQGVAVDSSGNIYIADTGNYVVREVLVGTLEFQTMITAAGSGSSVFSGDGAPATSAGLSAAAIAVDKAGDIFVADPANFRVREVLANGNIVTYAGTGTQGFSGDNGLATSAQLSAVSGLALDSSGDLYIADTGNHCIRKVSAAGTITTVAGNGKAGFSGDNGPAISAQLNAPAGVAVDVSGNLFISDTLNNRVRKVSVSGTITTIAGNGSTGLTGDGGVAPGASLSGPAALAMSKAGNIYVADTGNNAIRLLTVTTQTILVTSVVDAASETAVPATPGKIVVIYGTGLGPQQLAVNQPVNGFFGDSAGGTTVSIRGILAPVYYASATQVAAIVPYEITGSTAVPVVVGYQGQVSAPFNVSFTASSPSLFTYNASGTGQAAAINVVDGTLNTAANPVKTGAYISFYATGEGQTLPGGVDGKLAGLVPPWPKPMLNVTATVGGIAATVSYAGAAPGAVAGEMQVNVQIPTGVTPGGYVPVVLTVGTASTVNGALWIAVSN